jgi:type IV secretory pathway VirB6-like protein
MLHTLLLQSLPGVPSAIPGVPFEYIATMGATQIIEAYQRVRTASFVLMGLFCVLALGLHVVSLLGKANTTPKDIVLKALMCMVLLSIYPQIFGTVMSLTHKTSQVIFSDENTRELNEKFRAAAQAQLDEDNAERGASANFFQMASQMAALLNPTSALVIELISALATIAFFATAIFVGIMWKLLVGILFCTGPILIAMGMLPGIGGRIQGAWICSLIQVGFWQIWSAICALMVRTADSFFQPYFDFIQRGELTVTNHYESIAIMVAFTVLFWMGPMVIAWLLPISKTSAAFGLMYMTASMSAVRSLGNLASLAGGGLSQIFSGMKAGGAGVAAGGMSGSMSGAAGGQGSRFTYVPGYDLQGSRPMKYLGRFKAQTAIPSKGQLTSGNEGE